MTLPYAPTLALTASTTPRTTRAGGELARRDVLSNRSSALMRLSVAPAAGARTRDRTPAKRSSSGEVGWRLSVAWIWASAKRSPRAPSMSVRRAGGIEAGIVEGGRVDSRRKYESREPSISWPPAVGAVAESAPAPGPPATPPERPPAAGATFGDPPEMAAAAAVREKAGPPPAPPFKGKARRWIEPAEALLPSRGTPTPAWSWAC
jgi:hypothetical protein